MCEYSGNASLVQRRAARQRRYQGCSTDPLPGLPALPCRPRSTAHILLPAPSVLDHTCHRPATSCLPSTPTPTPRSPHLIAIPVEVASCRLQAAHHSPVHPTGLHPPARICRRATHVCPAVRQAIPCCTVLQAAAGGAPADEGPAAVPRHPLHTHLPAGRWWGCWVGGVGLAAAVRHASPHCRAHCANQAGTQSHDLGSGTACTHLNPAAARHASI